MKQHLHIEVPTEKLGEFCQRNHILRLAFFGSVLRDDFRPDSDVDVLVEFAPGHVSGLEFFGMQDELSLLMKRHVDLNTPGCFGPRLRPCILAQAETIYGQG